MLTSLSILECVIDIIALRIRALWTDNREVNFLLHSVWVLNVLGSIALVVNTVVKNQCMSIILYPTTDPALTPQTQLHTHHC